MKANLKLARCLPHRRTSGRISRASFPTCFQCRRHPTLWWRARQCQLAKLCTLCLTSELDAHTPAENADADETTASFSADILKPSRIQAAFLLQQGGQGQIRGHGFAALRENLSMGLADGLDKAILSSTTGLFTGTNLGNNTVSTVTDYDGYLSAFGYGRVDGRYASTVAEIRMVVGAGTYAHMGKVYRNTSVDRTILDRLMDVTGGVRVSAHVPAVTTAHKQNAVIKLGSSVGAVAPIWERRDHNSR